MNRKNLICVFVNNMQLKFLKMNIAFLVLMGFWCLWRYYGFIILNMYVSIVKALKNIFIKK